MSLPPALLAALREAGLPIEQNSTEEAAWFVESVVQGRGLGNEGPFASPDEALVHGIRRLVGVAREAQTERDAFWLEVRQLRQALDAAQAELRAEREARAQY